MTPLHYFAFLAAAWLIFFSSIMTVNGGNRFASALLLKVLPMMLGIILFALSIVPLVQ